MAEHDCKHEVNLANMGKDIEHMGDDVKKILRILDGNGKEGLGTRVKVVEKGLTRVWAWLIPLSVLIAASAIGAFVK